MTLADIAALNKKKKKKEKEGRVILDKAAERVA